MFGLILSMPGKYPLDMVVHFELENDWQIAKDVISYMEERCSMAGIKFLRIKPRKTWEELFDRYGYPNGKARWCNSDYKLDCKKQLNQWLKSQNCRPIAYIGFCADEIKRFNYEIGGDWNLQDECYPLAEEGVTEDTILRWARTQPIFEGYYDYFDRMGCKACPIATMKEWAYLLKEEPEEYESYLTQIKITENRLKEKNWLFKNIGAEEFDRRIREKWSKLLDLEMNQISFDL